MWLAVKLSHISRYCSNPPLYNLKQKDRQSISERKLYQPYRKYAENLSDSNPVSARSGNDRVTKPSAAIESFSPHTGDNCNWAHVCLPCRDPVKLYANVFLVRLLHVTWHSITSNLAEVHSGIISGDGAMGDKRAEKSVEHRRNLISIINRSS